MAVGKGMSPSVEVGGPGAGLGNAKRAGVPGRGKRWEVEILLGEVGSPQRLRKGRSWKAKTDTGTRQTRQSQQGCWVLDVGQEGGGKDAPTIGWASTVGAGGHKHPRSCQQARDLEERSLPLLQPQAELRRLVWKDLQRARAPWSSSWGPAGAASA